MYRLFKYLTITASIIIASFELIAQPLPHRMTSAEKQAMPFYLQSRAAASQGITTPPVNAVRTMAEWEELQGILVAWTSYNSMLREIIRAGKQETRMYVVCNNATTVETYLAGYNIDTVNVTFLQVPFNSVWSRDYGPWSAYTNIGDTLITVDWIYNRPRPMDDAVPTHIANAIGSPIYETTVAPYDLVHTGGNFMTDGFGTGFSSNLILNENTSKTEAQIDSIMHLFMGIDRYIKMGTLPYDVIHHIDMHMKLLDEETILMGEYPPGVADGPQIEANLLYVINNFNSTFGTPYKVERIPMPPDNGNYPGNNGRYFTYTNSAFINKTLIVPTYNIPEDTIALGIYEELLPGYNIVGINSLPSIGSLGALHCINKEIGTSDPLLISHQPLSDTYDDANPYNISAYVKHRSSIAAAIIHWRTDTALPYAQISMNLGFNPNLWFADIPPQPVGTTVYYYVEAISISGKTQVRPMPAPAGYWEFDILGTVGLSDLPALEFQLAFPNPSKGITCIPLNIIKSDYINIGMYDITGRMVEEIFNGEVTRGERKFFVNTQNIPSGVYSIRITSGAGNWSQKLIVK